MRGWRLWIVVAVLSLVAASCGGDSEELTFDEYVAEMTAIGTAFKSETPNPLDESARYPVGGDLVVATELYTVYDELLADWKSIIPPPAVQELHSVLVESLELLQEEVGDYLMDVAFEGGDFDFETIGPEVISQIEAAGAACIALQRELTEAGVAPFFGDCAF